MADSDPGKTLAALDFSALIGGPLVATINAQAQAAMVTMNFISTVGFKSDAGSDSKQLQTVDFEFERQIPQPDGTTTAESQKLSVPILTMVPIPFIRIEDMTIDLNVKIHSSTNKSTENDFNITDKTSTSGWWKPVSINVTASDKNVVKGSSETDQTYTMDVHVRAVQDQIPGGLGKILGIFEEVIEQQAKQKE